MSLRSDSPINRAIHLSPDATFITDAEGVIRGADVQSAKLFGYEPDELFGTPIEKLIPERYHSRHPSYRERLTRRRKARYSGAQGNPLGVRKNGTIFPMRHEIIELETPSGSVVMNLLKDITKVRSCSPTQELQEQQFRSIVDSVQDYAIYLLDPDGFIMSWNAGGAYIKGYSEEEAIGLNFSTFFTPQDLAQHKPQKLLHQAATYGRIEDEGWRVRKDGSQFWTDSVLTALRGESGEVTGYVKVTRDATARKLAEESMATRHSSELQASSEAIKASEIRYRTVFETSPEAVTIARMSDGVIVDVNQAVLDVLGYERDYVIGKTTGQLHIWARARDRLALVELLRQNAGCRDIEFQFRRKDGESFWARLTVSFIEINGTSCVISFARDISEAKLAERQIKNLAFYDPLTGLANRRLLMERLSQSLTASARSQRKRALLFIDLDDFKTLNDTRGHHVGDLLLQEVARRLTLCIRETDTVSRLGGDEFVIILEDLNETSEGAAAQAKAVAEKVLATVSRSYNLDGYDCRSSSSIGITIFGSGHKGVNEILQQADIAMYQAKAAGRKTIQFFSPTLQAAVDARASAEDDLRWGIQRKQFLLYYQPQVRRGRVIGAEALSRWKHPARGIIPPIEFIPLAEKTDLMVQLGYQALESACAQIAAWANHKLTADFTLSVNISLRQMRFPGFIEQVLTLLERTGADPQKLRLELTESMFVDNFDEVMTKMTTLKKHGLRFSVDDFGTGFSCLSYLKHLPIDELKIDRIFVSDIVENRISSAIAESIILLSQALGFSVIAEGVETEEQRLFLANLGCDSYQGWLYGPALPIEDFSAKVLNEDLSGF